MKKTMIFLFGLLLFSQINVFAMGGNKEQGEMNAKKKEDTVTTKAENFGNTVCPVTGEKINEKYKSTYEYGDNTYNFCCAGCVDEFKKDPGKYIKIMQEELKKKWELNLKIKDPVCNMEINPGEAYDSSIYNGRPCYFCSDECKKKFDKEPKKYIKQ